MNAVNQMDTKPEKLLPSTRVAILGLGLMGGSLAMALGGRCAQLLGYDPDPEAVRMAQTQQVVERASTQMDEILPLADLAILAAPVKQILHLLSELDDLHPGSAMVLDVGSTKRWVVDAMQTLPPRFDPLGGHPICGKEQSSLAYANPGLYHGAPFVLCRLERTSNRAVQLASELIQTVGSYPVWLTAEKHDRWIAATSHLPYLLANAVVQATPQEASTLVGPGYRSTTRLAASYAPMLLDVLETNQDMVLPALQTLQEAITHLEDCLKAGNWAEVREILQSSALRHAELIAGEPAQPISERLPGW